MPSCHDAIITNTILGGCHVVERILANALDVFWSHYNVDIFRPMHDDDMVHDARRDASRRW
jgi:hypothetical protein